MPKFVSLLSNDATHPIYFADKKRYNDTSTHQIGVNHDLKNHHH